MIVAAGVVVGVVVGAVVAAVLARALLVTVAIVVEQRSLPPIDHGPAVSIVIPLYGWDERLLSTLRVLGQSAPRFDALEIIVVVDDDHPRRAQLAALPLVQVLAPSLAASLELLSGDVDKVRRLRCGARVARHALVLLFDSDVVVDDDGWLLRRVAAHVHDPGLRLSFALPAYHQARGAGDAVLASFTLHWNLTLYFLGWRLLRNGTSIAAGQAVRNDDGVLPALLDSIRGSLVDDHALGFLVKKRGERVRALPSTVTVHASDPSWSATTAQVVRWLSAARTVGPLLTPTTLLWGTTTTLLSNAGPVCFVAFVVSTIAQTNDASTWLVGAVACPVIDALSLIVDEALVGRRRPRLHALWSLPASVLLLPWWTALALTRKQVVWRERVSSLDAATADSRRNA